MNPVLLRALMPFISGFFWMLSFFLFLRGHNEPGGGFIGALCFCLGLLAFSFSRKQPTELFIRARPYARLGVLGGLSLFLLTLGLPLLFSGEPLQAFWSNLQLPVAGKLSSVLLFDTGVYLIVISAIVFIFCEVFAGEEHD
jgi:multisubunit Na+/H+ antiporter MnhB subunit